MGILFLILVWVVWIIYKKFTRIDIYTIDLHLRINNPEYKLEWIGIHKDDMVSIH